MIWKAATEGDRGLDGPSSRSQGFLAREGTGSDLARGQRASDRNKPVGVETWRHARLRKRARCERIRGRSAVEDPAREKHVSPRGQKNEGVLSQTREMMGVEETLEIDILSEAIFRDQLDSSWRSRAFHPPACAT